MQALLFMTLGNFNDSAYSPLAPFIKSDFLLSSAQLGLITSFIFIGSLTMSSMTGYFVDRLGRNTALKIAFGMMALGSLVAGSAQNYPEIVSGFFIIGFGYGIVTPSTNSSVMAAYYPHHARSMGIKQSGVPLGAALAALALPLVALHFSLRDALILMALISGVLAIGIARDIRPDGSKGSGKGYVREFFSTWRNRLLLLVSLPVAFLSWGQQSLLTYFVVYMRFRGFPIIGSEILLAVLLAGSVAGRLFWVNLSERMFSRNRSRMIAMIMLIAGLLFITFSLMAGNILEAGVMAFVLGMSAIGWNSTYVTLISEIAPRDRIGLFSGVSLMMISLGTILGTPLSGTVVDLISYDAMWRLIGLFLLLMSLTVALMQRYIARHISRTPDP